jgi:hypothetical protein
MSNITARQVKDLRERIGNCGMQGAKNLLIAYDGNEELAYEGRYKPLPQPKNHAAELAEALRALLGVSNFSVIAVQAEDTLVAYEDSLK